ncbi:hypothetical protein Patl1_34418 [Pistacia atlantica]|uniref:Uncharacterized protein n=1 Tax=Pistacia atlantica TaxID=434234 RepID=A0ACC0ZUL9_9ROSI|nr:hypothetical protein Patl1_34418 [Pistacia atlantica]
MDAVVKKFEVKCLSFEESFELFRQCVTEDVLNSHHQITEFAETVAKECKGLPLALITIGRAMSNRRTPEEWRYAINTLRVIRRVCDMESSVFQVLRFSYDSLRDDKHKNCFLYCSLFPEDHMIRKDELIDLWIAEGILHNYGLNDTRDAGEFIIRSLKHACLLEMVGDSDDYVKTHDVLRDMALWLASVKENKIKNPLKNMALLHGRRQEEYHWSSNVKLFFETPFCPCLLTFVYLNLSDTVIEELPVVANSFDKIEVSTFRWHKETQSYLRRSDIKSFIAPSVQQSTNCNWPAVFSFLLEYNIVTRVSNPIVRWQGVAFAQHILFALTKYATWLRFVFAENCPLLEEIIPYEFNSSSSDLNMFKNLKQLNFSNLPLLKSICRVMHFPSLERIWVSYCLSLTKLPLDLHSENNSRISILGDKEWRDKLEWENSSSKVSYPSMHQTALVSGLAAQSCSYSFPRIIVADRLSDAPSYTYEATKFENMYVSSVLSNPV